MANQAKQSFIGRVLATKKRAESGLQAIGTQIGANEAQGMSDFKTGKIPYNAAINPLKGTLAAFRAGYKK